MVLRFATRDVVSLVVGGVLAGLLIARAIVTTSRVLRVVSVLEVLAVAAVITTFIITHNPVAGGG